MTATTDNGTTSGPTADVSLSGLTDPDGDPTTLTIDAVTQDEPISDPAVDSGQLYDAFGP